MASRHMKPDTSDFLKKFARVLKNADIKAFHWSDDGRYVVVNWKLCEEERVSHRKAFSIFKRVKDITSLRRLLCFHGFKKIARRSGSDVLVFEHHDFVQRGMDNTRSKSSGSCSYFGDMEGSWSMSNNVLLDMCFSPVKRKNARTLYQYINFSSAPEAESPNPPQHDPTSNPQCTSVSLDDVQRSEELDPGHSNTANDPETGKSLGSLDETPLQESVLNLCQTGLLPPLSPHPQNESVSDDFTSNDEQQQL